MEVAVGIFKNKGWALPPELHVPDPEQESTLLVGIRDYLEADEMNRTQRKLFAIDRLVGYLARTLI